MNVRILGLNHERQGSDSVMIGQFLHEHGYTQALEAITNERYRRRDVAMKSKSSARSFRRCDRSAVFLSRNLFRYSGRRFDPATMVKKTGELQSILGEDNLRHFQHICCSLKDEHLAKENRREEASVSLYQLVRVYVYACVCVCLCVCVGVCVMCAYVMCVHI